jgi:GT2 family glycosyltransferase
VSYVKANSKGEDVEVIVVSNGCKDGTVEFIEQLDPKENISLIKNIVNEGFGKAVNKGVKAATGEWIIVLNDDVVVPKGFLKKFETDCKEYKRISGTKNASIAVPMSNYVGMRSQQHQCPSRQHAEAVAKDVYTKNYRQIQTIGIVSGLMMFINKEVFETIGYFDERFFAGCEDVDFAVRAYEAGFISIICKDIFVWHYGSKTIDRMPELKRGTAHIKDLIEKYATRTTEKQTLGVIYRVKLRDDYDADVFARSLEKSATFADHIFILDDDSPVRFSQDFNKLYFNTKEEISVDLPCKITVKKHDRNFDERRDRNELLQMAKEAKMDWVFSIDADEVVEDKVDRKLIDRLIGTPDPMTQGYQVHYYTFWNDEEHYNAGDVWKAMCGTRLVRLTGDPIIYMGAKSTFHVGNIPNVPGDMQRMSGIRIKHYGYVHPAQRQRKYEWYEKMDTDKNPALIGHADYKHLINENPLILRQWIEDSSISLCTIMKNEQASLFDFLRSYMPFLDEAVIVDTGSTDDSVEIAKLFGVNVIEGNSDELYEDCDGIKAINFGKARNKALEASTSTWVLHMDIDEHLDHLNTVRRMLDSGMDGYMFYVNNLMPDNRYSLSETVRIFRKSCGFTYSGLVHETISQNNHQHKIGRAPMKLNHFGYLKPQEVIRKKMQNYFKLNQKQIEMSPKDPRPYYAIAIHYLEEGFVDEAETNLLQAYELDNNFYQAQKDLGYLYLNKARIYFNQVQNLLQPDHPFQNLCSENTRAIDEMVGHQSQVSPGHLEGII